MDKKYIIYLDFDGTVVEHTYPEIGRCNFGCIEVIHKLQKSGHKIVLNTMRVEFQDGTFEKALNWFDKAYMFLKDKSNIPEDFEIKIDDHTTRKLNPIWDWEFFYDNNLIFIDDQCLNIPTKPAAMSSGRIVDWDALEQFFIQKGVIKVS